MDGLDLLDLAVSFAAQEESLLGPPDPRYNPATDLDGNGIVEGPDLVNVTSQFGEVCH